MYSIKEIKKMLNETFVGFETTLNVKVDENDNIKYEGYVWDKNSDIICSSFGATSPKYMIEELKMKFQRDSVFKVMFDNVIID